MNPLMTYLRTRNNSPYCLSLTTEDIDDIMKQCWYTHILNPSIISEDTTWVEQKPLLCYLATVTEIILYKEGISVIIECYAARSPYVSHTTRQGSFFSNISIETTDNDMLILHTNTYSTVCNNTTKDNDERDCTIPITQSCLNHIVLGFVSEVLLFTRRHDVKHRIKTHKEGSLYE